MMRNVPPIRSRTPRYYSTPHSTVHSTVHSTIHGPTRSGTVSTFIMESRSPGAPRFFISSVPAVPQKRPSPKDPGARRLYAGTLGTVVTESRGHGSCRRRRRVADSLWADAHRDRCEPPAYPAARRSVDQPPALKSRVAIAGRERRPQEDVNPPAGSCVPYRLKFLTRWHRRRKTILRRYR